MLHSNHPLFGTAPALRLWRQVALFCILTSLVIEAAEQTRRISTVAGTGTPGYSGDGGPALRAQLNNPYGLCRGPDGALYLCDMGNHVVRRIDNQGVITTVVGTGRRGYAGDGGPAIDAELNEPYEIRFDSEGNMFIVEMKNHLVRRVDARSKNISTFAGTGTAGFSGDGGRADEAMLRQPHSIQFDDTGHLYICDIGNHRIRKVDPATGTITTLAGTGSKDPTPDGASFHATPLNGPRALDFDQSGNLWLALREGNAIHRFDMAKGIVYHAAGTGDRGFSGNGGPARIATLSGPKGISIGPGGAAYFADTESHSIRQIDPDSGLLFLIAGTGERGDGPDGNPLLCRLSRPHGIFVDQDGAVYVGDSENHRIRVIQK